MYRKITFFTVIIALIVIVLGTYVRLSDAQMGCPDWPGCYGSAIIQQGADFKAQANALFPAAPLDTTKAWKVLSHRYSAAFFGVLALILFLTAWSQKQCRVATMGATLLLLILVGLKTGVGWWATTVKFMPVVVTGHILLSFIVFWVAFRLYLSVNPTLRLNQLPVKTGPRGFAIFAMLILFLQIILGSWVSTNQAALACGDFPRCNEQWMPAVDYLSSLDLFSSLQSGYSSVLSYDGQVAIHWLHRVGALVCFILLSIVMLSATSEHYARPVRKAGLWLSILLLAQILLGIFSVKLEAPVWIAVLHSVVAALLMLPLIAISFFSKYSLLEDLAETDIALRKPDVEQKTSSLDAEIDLEKAYREPSDESLYLRLKSQLKKTRTGLGGVLSSISLGQKGINDDLLEEIEANLLIADIGVDATSEIIAQLSERMEKHQLNDGEALERTLKEILLDILQPSSQNLVIPEQDTPFVILVVGINGVGKTTTIGKMAKRLQVQGHSVMLAAGDTFRAAAVEQLETWGERNNIHVVAQHTGADSASVIFDAVQSAKAKGIDVLIADTAGRLHTKSNLMEELSKIKRIMSKVDQNAPHEVLLVLDAGTGQNALSQTKIFNESAKLTGLALTKLDGTAKGGVIFALARQFGLPIRYIGVGEGIDDLQDFDAKSFIDALFVKD